MSVRPVVYKVGNVLYFHRSVVLSTGPTETLYAGAQASVDNSAKVFSLPERHSASRPPKAK